MAAQGASAKPAPAPDFFHQDTLTGDWNGTRTIWKNKGVDLASSLTQFYQGVSSGGTGTSSEYNGTAPAKVGLDFGKLGGWNDWSAEIWCADRLQAVKWRHYKVHFYQQETMIVAAGEAAASVPVQSLHEPARRRDQDGLDSWIIGPVLKMVGAFEASLKKYPLIPMGTPDPYRPPTGPRLTRDHSDRVEGDER